MASVIVNSALLNINYNIGRNSANATVKVRFDATLNQEQLSVFDAVSQGNTSATHSKLKTLTQSGHDIDVKFNCNGEPFLCFLVTAGKIDELNIILDIVKEKYRNPSKQLESEHCKVSGIYAKLLLPAAAPLERNKSHAITRLLQTGIDITAFDSETVCPLVILLSYDFDGESFRSYLISQLTLTYPKFRNLLIDGVPLVIHMAANIGLFSEKVIRDLYDCGVDFSVTHDGHRFQSVLRNLCDRHILSEDEYHRYLNAAGIDEHEDMVAGYIAMSDTALETEESRKDRRVVESATSQFASGLPRLYEAKPLSRKWSKSNIDLSGSGRGTQTQDTDQSQKEPDVRHPPRRTKRRFVSHIPYAVIRIKSMAAKKFHYKVAEDELSLLTNREALSVDDLWQKQSEVNEAIQEFYPVLDVSEDQKAKVRKKFKIDDMTKRNRSYFRKKNKILCDVLNEKKRRKESYPEQLPPPSPSLTERRKPDEARKMITPADEVFDENDTADGRFTAEDYKRRYSSSARNSVKSYRGEAELLLPDLITDDEDREINSISDACAKNTEGTGLFLPVFTSEETVKRDIHVKKFTAEDVVRKWQTAAKETETSTKLLREAADKARAANIVLERWKRAYKHVRTALEKADADTEVMGAAISQIDSDFSEKLSQVKADDHLSHGGAAALHGIQAMGCFAQITQVYRDWNTSGYLNTVNSLSGAAGVVLGGGAATAETMSHLITDITEPLKAGSNVLGLMDSVQKGCTGVVNLLKSLKDARLLDKVNKDAGLDTARAEAYFEEGEKYSESLAAAAKDLTDAASDLCGLINSEPAMLERLTPVLGVCVYCLDLSKRCVKLAHDIHGYCNGSEIKQRLKETLCDYPVTNELLDEHGKTIAANLHAVVFNHDCLGNDVLTDFEYELACRYFTIREIKQVSGKRIKRQLFGCAMDGLAICAEILILGSAGFLSPLALGIAGSVAALKGSALAYRAAKQEFHDLMNDLKSKAFKKKDRIEVVMNLVKQLGYVLMTREKGIDQSLFLAQIFELDICFTAAGMPLQEFIAMVDKEESKQKGTGFTRATAALYAAFESRD